MASRQWYIQYNDSVLGPFSSSQLRKMAERSQITPDVKVRVGEDGNWRLASSVKGLFSNSVLANFSKSSESTPDETPFSTTSSSDSNSSSELSTGSFEAATLEQKETPEEKPSATIGEMPSVAPPVPGEVPVRGEVPVHGEPPVRGELPPPLTPNSGSYGEIPTPPPPIASDGLDWSASSKGRSGRKNRSQNAIPALIRELIGAEDEQILYAAHPAFTVLLIQGALTLMGFVFLGVIPSYLMISNLETGSGYFWLFCSTLVTLFILAVHYLRWIRSSYVITNERTFVKSGIFSVEVGYIYNANIQMLKIRTGFIDKILHLNTIELRTSAGFLSLRWTPLTEVLKFYRK